MTSQERFDIVKEILEKNNLSLCTLNIQQFDNLSDLELIAGAKNTVMEIKRYEKYINTNKMKYPESIMRCVRRNLGLREMDTSKDLEIYKMSRKEVLNAVCTWNGLTGYGYTVAGWIEDIWQIELEE